MAPLRLLGCGLLCALPASTATASARADERSPPLPDARAPVPASAHSADLGLFTGAGYLGSPGAEGAAFLAGLRLGVDRHFAASVDLGYGLLRADAATQDRWWVIPSVSLAIPAGAVRFDVGAGAGVGTSSGYVSWSDYAARPFTPVWHYTVPAARVHLVAAIDITPTLAGFARIDVASLLSAASQAGPMDTTWFALWIGVQPRLL